MVSFTFGCPTPEVVATLRGGGIGGLGDGHRTVRGVPRPPRRRGRPGGAGPGGRRPPRRLDRSRRRRGLRAAGPAAAGGRRGGPAARGDRRDLRRRRDRRRAGGGRVGGPARHRVHAGPRGRHPPRAPGRAAGDTPTALTRAFTGRQARGLRNRFLAEHTPDAVAAYPEVHHATSPLRAAARAAGDAGGFNLWAGQAHRLARPAPAGEIVASLAEEARAALQPAG